MKSKLQQNYSIYIHCQSQSNKKYEESNSIREKYGIMKSFLFSGLSYAEIITKAISECQDDFALICHDDVVLPIDITHRVNRAVENVQSEVGENWGVVGNFGKEFISHKKLKFVRDLSSDLIPPSSIKSRPVIAIDDNVLLLNVKAIKKNKIIMPSLGLNSKLTANVLLIECYLHGLICFVDSNLFVFYKDFENIANFEEKIESEKFFKYWRNLFINHEFITIHEPIKIKNSLNYLNKENNDKRLDLYSIIEKLILSKLTRKIEINIIIRSMLNRLNLLDRSLELIKAGYFYNKENVTLNVIISANNVSVPNPEEILDSLVNKHKEDISIKYVISKNGGDLYPRVQSIKDAIDSIDNEESFAWIVDDDDFIFPNSIKYFSSMLDQRYIFVANSTVFEEKWGDSDRCTPSFSKKKDVMNGERYFEIINGDNNVPVCSVVYPVKVLSNVFLENNLKGDYAEDYAIFLLAIKDIDVVTYPLSIAGISYHGANTVLEESRTHWNYSYTTFMSEVVNSGIMKEWMHEYVKYIKDEESVKTDIGLFGLLGFFSRLYRGEYDEILKKAHNVLKKKGIRKTMQFAISYVRHGRKYFKDGVNVLDEHTNKN